MIKENRERRRHIKNELIVISSVLKMDLRNLDRDVVDKVVTGLTKRKFRYRVADGDVENVV